MERFQTRHADRIVAILSGFDRLLFRGTLQSIAYVSGFDIFLSSHRVLYKDFGAFAAGISDQLKSTCRGPRVEGGSAVSLSWRRPGSRKKISRARSCATIRWARG